MLAVLVHSRQLVAVSARLDGCDRVFFLNGSTGEHVGTIPRVDRLGWSANGKRMAFSQDGRSFAAGLRNTTALI